MAGRSKADTPAKPQPHRFRVSVPAADEAVVAWMELQDNPSQSVRLLIRESIERNGYIDVVNRPVAQLPQRGGPAGSPEDSRSFDDENAQPTLPAPAAASGQDAEAPARRNPPAQEDPTASASDPSEPELPSGGQLDVNDIFSLTR